MALTTKPRPGANHKKIKADHHRHSKTYLKTYWPYIPIIGIVVLGFLINRCWHINQSTGAKTAAYTYYNVLETSIGGLALAIFLLRHAFAWHKVMVLGEEFATKHPFMDIALVGIATAGLLLTRNRLMII